MNKLYRADIVDINGNYLAKTVNSIDIGLKTSDVINQKKLTTKFKFTFFQIKILNEIKKNEAKKFFWS